MAFFIHKDMEKFLFHTHMYIYIHIHMYIMLEFWKMVLYKFLK